MEHKCEWQLENTRYKQIPSKFIRRVSPIQKNHVCEMSPQNHYYKHDGKIYCIFHSPLNGVNLKTGKKKSEELKKFQEALDNFHYSYRCSKIERTNKFLAKQDASIKKGKKVNIREIGRSVGRSKIKYEFNGVIFPTDIKLMNVSLKEIHARKDTEIATGIGEKIENKFSKVLIVHMKENLSNSISMKNCEFFGSISKADKREIYTLLRFDNSVFHSSVNLSNFFAKQASFQNCKFEGSVNFKNTRVDFADFSKCIFNNSFSLIDFSWDKDTTIPIREQSTVFRSGWNFSNTEISGDVSFQNRFFNCSLDFSNAKIKSKFNFLNTRIQQETSFYNTNFTDISSFGQDVCYRILKVIISKLGNTKLTAELEYKERKTILNIEKSMKSYLQSKVLKGNARWEKVYDVLKKKIRNFEEKNGRKPEINEEANLLETVMIEYPEYAINSKKPSLFLSWESFSKNFRKYMKLVKGETKYQTYK